MKKEGFLCFLCHYNTIIRHELAPFCIIHLTEFGNHQSERLAHSLCIRTDETLSLQIMLNIDTDRRNAFGTIGIPCPYDPRWFLLQMGLFVPIGIVIGSELCAYISSSWKSLSQKRLHRSGKKEEVG